MERSVFWAALTFKRLRISGVGFSLLNAFFSSIRPSIPFFSDQLADSLQPLDVPFGLLAVPRKRLSELRIILGLLLQFLEGLQEQMLARINVLRISRLPLKKKLWSAENLPCTVRWLLPHRLERLS